MWKHFDFRTRLFVAFYVLLSLLDTALTIKLLNMVTIWHGEFDISEIETNPLAKQVMMLGGIDGLMWYKTILVSIIFLCLIGFKNKYPRLSKHFMWYAILVTGLVVSYGFLWVQMFNYL